MRGSLVFSLFLGLFVFLSVAYSENSEASELTITITLDPSEIIEVDGDKDPEGPPPKITVSSEKSFITSCKAPKNKDNISFNCSITAENTCGLKDNLCVKVPIPEIGSYHPSTDIKSLKYDIYSDEKPPNGNPKITNCSSEETVEDKNIEIVLNCTYLEPTDTDNDAEPLEECSEMVEEFKKCCSSQGIYSCLKIEAPSITEAFDGKISDILSKQGYAAGALLTVAPSLKVQCEKLSEATTKYSEFNDTAYKMCQSKKDLCMKQCAEEPEQIKECSKIEVKKFSFLSILGKTSNLLAVQCAEDIASSKQGGNSPQTRPAQCNSPMAMAALPVCQKYCEDNPHQNGCQEIERPQASRSSFDDDEPVTYRPSPSEDGDETIFSFPEPEAAASSISPSPSVAGGGGNLGGFGGSAGSASSPLKPQDLNNPSLQRSPKIGYSFGGNTKYDRHSPQARREEEEGEGGKKRRNPLKAFSMNKRKEEGKREPSSLSIWKKITLRFRSLCKKGEIFSCTIEPKGKKKL